MARSFAASILQIKISILLNKSASSYWISRILNALSEILMPSKYTQFAPPGLRPRLRSATGVQVIECLLLPGREHV